MHILTTHIVYATNEDEAKKKAIENADKLCEGGRPYDWYYDEGGRWDECLKPVHANSDEGKRLIEGGWNNLIEDRSRYWNNIQSFFSAGGTFDELFEGKKYSMTKYYFYALGNSENSYLYDNDAEGIDDKYHLENAIAMWPDADGKTGQDHDVVAWVVPIDMHS